MAASRIAEVIGENRCASDHYWSLRIEPVNPRDHKVYKYDHENTRRPVCPETKVGSQEEVTKAITRSCF